MNTTELQNIKQKAIDWANQSEVCLLLDNNESINAFGVHDAEFIMAAGAKYSITGDNQNDFEKLKAFKETHTNNYILGYLTYDLKNQIEKLQSNHIDSIQFPSLYFFVPEHLLIINKNHQIIFKSSQFNSFEEWLQTSDNRKNTETSNQKICTLKQRISKENYLVNIEKIKNHILEGDVYELNYCMEFFDDNAKINPTEIYQKLKAKSPVPFGAYLKYFDQYLICASPERFICKRKNQLISQPIKGTVKRNLLDEEKDNQLKASLLNSEKERAENLMIVDLVRNDLAHSSKTGSVKVDELFGIYSFQQVHQMISTVSSTIKDEINPIDAIQHAFPMGSMTGAPKVMAMELIEQYEQTKRGLYSGAVGYFTPEGNFDFNVVIRSIQYNKANNYLNIMVGGAITFDSIEEQEYEECLLKAQATMQSLQ
ncbi:MAG: anthranilate synthase component I family protein [Bacteroidia bacterium]|nr:anthranilate synthase component I family protein [Bacteroidia bacterium]